MGNQQIEKGKRRLEFLVGDPMTNSAQCDQITVKVGRFGISKKAHWQKMMCLSRRVSMTLLAQSIRARQRCFACRIITRAPNVASPALPFWMVWPRDKLRLPFRPALPGAKNNLSILEATTRTGNIRPTPFALMGFQPGSVSKRLPLARLVMAFGRTELLSSTFADEGLVTDSAVCITPLGSPDTCTRTKLLCFAHWDKRPLAGRTYNGVRAGKCTPSGLPVTCRRAEFLWPRWFMSKNLKCPATDRAGPSFLDFHIISIAYNAVECKRDLYAWLEQNMADELAAITKRASK